MLPSRRLGQQAPNAAAYRLVPAVLEKLTDGQTKVKVEDTECDRLFIVTQRGLAKESRAIELRC